MPQGRPRKVTIEQQHHLETFANPYLCLSQMNPALAQKHETLISEDTFVQTGAKLIAKMGAESYLRMLLENLRGQAQPTSQTNSKPKDQNVKQQGKQQQEPMRKDQTNQ